MRSGLVAWLGRALLALAIVLPSHGAWAQSVGAVDPANGFPTTYTDGNGLTLELCLDDELLCLLEVPPPLSFPTVFPEEAFWWAAEASMPTRTVEGVPGEALLVLAAEAAFNPEVVADGNQVSFGRIRIRVDNLVDGATYTVIHPYGVEVFVAEGGAARGINFTEDIGCEVQPCDFSLALASRVFQSFLTWDPVGDAPDGRIGDPQVEHVVTGSPTGSNFFQIVGPNVGELGNPNLCSPGNVNCIRTDLFSVLGKIAGAAPPPQPAVDTLTVNRAEFRIRGGQWRVQGTTTLPGALIAVSTGGSVVGQATAAGDGRWQLRVRNSPVSPVGGVINVSSSGGGVLNNVPVTIRN